MGKFKKYLQENDDLLHMINDMLEELSEEEIHGFGEFMFHEYFEGSEETERNEFDDEFQIEDVKLMVQELGEEHYESIIYFLQPDDFEDDEETKDTSDHDEHHAIGENVFKKSVRRVRNIKLRKDKKKRSGVWRRFKKNQKRLKGSARAATMGGGIHRKKLKPIMRKILKKRRKKRMNI